MLSEAAEIVAARQVSKKQPRKYSDYRQMLAERDLDVVLVGTPDHWHALPMIAACEAGADVYVEKPISVDVVEGQAMVAAARKHRRVVQVKRNGEARRTSSRPAIASSMKGCLATSATWISTATGTCDRTPIRRITSAAEPGLRNVDRARADAALQRARSSADLAGLYRIR